MTNFTLSNINDFVGRELGVSSWMTVDQLLINQFANCTGDRQWIHVAVTTRALGPSGSGRSTSVSAPAKATQAEPETGARPPAPACPRHDRRVAPIVLRIELPVIVHAL